MAQVIPMDDEVGEACGEGSGSPTLQILPLNLKANFVVVLLEATKNEGRKVRLTNHVHKKIKN